MSLPSWMGGAPPAHARREPIRILVADDSVTMRNALVALLAQEQDLRIVGEARDGVEAVEKARELRPDVITMDVNMPRLDGLGATAAIMAESPARVLCALGCPCGAAPDAKARAPDSRSAPLRVRSYMRRNASEPWE